MALRGFEIIKGWEDKGINLPRRSTTHAAGYDLEAAVDTVIPPFRPGMKPTFVETGIKAYCQPDECYYIINRSSGAGKGIWLPNGIGLIDADYYNNPTNDGHLYVLICNTTDHNLEIKKGDRIAQVVFQKFLTADQDLVEHTDRQGGFGSTDRRPLKVVYDIDDTLWELTKLVNQTLGIVDGIQTDFHIMDDPAFTDEEKTNIVSAYTNPDLFEKAQFYPEARQILDAEPLGAQVYINSNVYSEPVYQIKQRRILELLPDLNPDHLQLNLVQPDTGHKQISADTFIFIDDSPYNIASSAAQFNLMPKKSWNAHAKAQQIATNKTKILVEDWRSKIPNLVKTGQQYVIPIENLAEANEFVQQVIKLKQGV